MTVLQHDGTPTTVSAWPEANFDRTIQLPAGANITHVGEYSTAAHQVTFMIGAEQGGSYDVVALQAFSHPGGGWADVALPFVVPATGTYRMGAFWQTVNDTGNRASGEPFAISRNGSRPSGLGVLSGFSNLNHCMAPLRATIDGEGEPPGPPPSSGRVVIAVNGQSNANQFASGNGAATMLSALQAAFPGKTFVLVNNGVNSSWVESWVAGAANEVAAITRTQAAMQAGDTLVEVWIQGEGGDAYYPEKANAYEANLRNHLADFRAQMNAPSMLSVVTISFNIGPGWPHQYLVQQAQLKIGTDYTQNNASVTMADFGEVVSQHPGDAVLVAVGHRIAAAIIARL